MGMFLYKEVTLIDPKIIPNLLKIISAKTSAKLCKIQRDTSILILTTDRSRSTVIFNRKDYLEKCMDHISNTPYQLDHTTILPKSKPRH